MACAPPTDSASTSARALRLVLRLAYGSRKGLGFRPVPGSRSHIGLRCYDGSRLYHGGRNSVDLRVYLGLRQRSGLRALTLVFALLFLASRFSLGFRPESGSRLYNGWSHQRWLTLRAHIMDFAIALARATPVVDAHGAARAQQLGVA